MGGLWLLMLAPTIVKYQASTRQFGMHSTHAHEETDHAVKLPCVICVRVRISLIIGKNVIGHVKL